SLSSGEYLPGSLQGKISSDGCLKKEQMVVSAIASTPQQDISEPRPTASAQKHREFTLVDSVAPDIQE
ncbi:hypothetical protein OTG69_27775, partial [Escherichia coli]|uniref:hypothetical protein n=1 Tax=Escherichia coli TaxID=562 RepID=UPI002264EE29